MQIYGQHLKTIFRQLPWQHKIIVSVGAAFVLLVMVWAPYVFLSRLVIASTPRVEPVAVGAQGASVFDPAITYDPRQKQAWMAYATAEKSSTGSMMHHVRLARAEDGCRNWFSSAGGFDGKPDDILAPDGQTVFRTGAWRVETPALVHDPDDKGREWKLYAYKYFWPAEQKQALQVAQHYGVITYKYASDPAKEWSTEQWLFSPAPDYPPVPYQSMILLHLNRLSLELSDVVTYARPSVIYKGGVLFMTLSAFTGGETPDRVIMIASRDHGQSWLYLGAVLQQADVSALGAYTVLSGANLMEEKGHVYLAAVLGSAAKRGQGTFVFEFDNIAKALLKRKKDGAPVLVQQVPLQNDNPAALLGGGFAAYADACPQGMIIAEQSGTVGTFQILKTHKKPSGK